MTHIWLRAEDRQSERRTPLTPEGAARLKSLGFEVTVEQSPRRIIKTADYEAVGCSIAAARDWIDAPGDAFILGLKELRDPPVALGHRHIYFGHAYKGQTGADDLLGRFNAGRVNGGMGALLDLEYLVDESGMRVTAFGYWAGYVGCALALMQWLGTKGDGQPFGEGLQGYDSKDALDAAIRALNPTGLRPDILVIGAAGRSGQGAVDLLRRQDLTAAEWDKDETAVLDRSAIARHEILVNCVLINRPIPPFFRIEDITAESRISVVVDVSCDPLSDFNTIPVYAEPTTWREPALRVENGQHAIDLLAIDNLPSLLPLESSLEFAGQLLPHLETLADVDTDFCWQAARTVFEKFAADVA